MSFKIGEGAANKAQADPSASVQARPQAPAAQPTPPPKKHGFVAQPPSAVPSGKKGGEILPKALLQAAKDGDIPKFMQLGANYRKENDPLSKVQEGALTVACNDCVSKAIDGQLHTAQLYMAAIQMGPIQAAREYLPVIQPKLDTLHRQSDGLFLALQSTKDPKQQKYLENKLAFVGRQIEELEGKKRDCLTLLNPRTSSKEKESVINRLKATWQGKVEAHLRAAQFLAHGYLKGDSKKVVAVDQFAVSSYRAANIEKPHGPEAMYDLTPNNPFWVSRLINGKVQKNDPHFYPKLTTTSSQ